MGDQGNNSLDPPYPTPFPFPMICTNFNLKAHLIYIHDSIPVHTLVIKCPPGVPWDLHLCIIKLANVLPNLMVERSRVIMIGS
jgi:hypothetical protein